MRPVSPILIVALIIAFACSMPSIAAAKDIDWYKKHGVTIVNPPKTAPNSYKAVNGEAKGFIVDIWRNWSQKTGIPVHFQFAPWSETLEGVRTGVYDIHGGLFLTKERLQYLDFSKPYKKIQAALLVDQHKDTDVASVYAKLRIGVLNKGYAQSFLSKKYPNAKLVPLPTTAAIAKAMVDGSIDAIAGDHPTMGYEVGNFGKSNSLVLKEIIYEQALHGATAKGNQTLLRLMDGGLSKISPDEFRVIHDRWFVGEVEEVHWLRNSLVIFAVLFVGILLFFFSDLWKTRKEEEDQ